MTEKRNFTVALAFRTSFCAPRLGTTFLQGYACRAERA